MTPARIALLVIAAVIVGRLSATMPARRSDDVEDTDDLAAFRDRMSGEAQRVERAEMSVVGS